MRACVALRLAVLCGGVLNGLERLAHQGNERREDCTHTHTQSVRETGLQITSKCRLRRGRTPQSLLDAVLKQCHVLERIESELSVVLGEDLLLSIRQAPTANWPIPVSEIAVTFHPIHKARKCENVKM